MLDLQQFDAFQPDIPRKVELGPRKFLIVEKGEVVEERLEIVLLALLEHVMGPHAGVARGADEASDSTAAG